ncbi:MAG: hypothetical protein QNI96_05065 [Woeseiaceae bacterium]|nr:hypothetical protein [Woeseiaceae bacterium]
MGFFSDLFKTKSTSRNDPYAEASGAIDAGLGLLERGMASPWRAYGGDLVAGFNPYQMGAFEGMAGYGAGMGGGIANALTGAGLAGLGGGLDAYGNVMSGLDGGAPQVGQIDFDYARSIAENPYVDGMIADSLRDPYRQLTEQTMPGIDVNAAMAGQASGSRAGVAEALANRAYDDRAADVAANIRGAAYNQGLGMAQQQAMANPSLALQGLGLQLNAGNALTSLGMGGLGQGYGMGVNNLSLGLTAGDRMQAQAQRGLDSAYEQYQRNQMLPFLQAQMGLPMASQIGGQFGTQTNTQSMNPVGGLLNIGGQIAGGMMAGGMNPFGAIAGMFGGGGGGAPQSAMSYSSMGTYNPFAGMFPGMMGAPPPMASPMGTYNPFAGMFPGMRG